MVLPYHSTQPGRAWSPRTVRREVHIYKNYVHHVQKPVEFLVEVFPTEVRATRVPEFTGLPDRPKNETRGTRGEQRKIVWEGVIRVRTGIYCQSQKNQLDPLYRPGIDGWGIHGIPAEKTMLLPSFQNKCPKSVSNLHSFYVGQLMNCRNILALTRGGAEFAPLLKPSSTWKDGTGNFCPFMLKPSSILATFPQKRLESVRPTPCGKKFDDHFAYFCEKNFTY